MKKILLGLGTIAMIGTPMVAVVSCGNSKSSSNKDAQQDVDKVLQEFQNASLVVNTQNLVKAASGTFNAKVLTDLGTYNGVYPGTPLPNGVTMTYMVKNINIGQTDNLVVTISKSGAKSKTFNIIVNVTKAKLVDVNSEDLAKANMTYDSGTKTLTIGDKVGEINFDISSITGWNIEHINWGKNPQNILKIGDGAFATSILTTLNLSGLTNLNSIGTGAFSASTLTTINFSGLTNLNSIGSDAFGHSTLTTLNLSGLTNLSSIGDGAFATSTLIILNLSGLTNLSSIGTAAFAHSTLTALNLSGLTSLTNIGTGAFYASTLTTLNLSGLTNLSSIGTAAFAHSTLSALDLSGLTSLTNIGGGAFYASTLSTLDFSGLTNLNSIGTGAFSASTLSALDLSGLTNLSSIGDDAFAHSTLTTLNLSGLTNLNSIGTGAFKSIQQNLQLRMEEAKYQELIYVDGGINNLNAIFGSNGNTVQRINP